MPKVTITIEVDFEGAADVELQRPMAFILKNHATYLLENNVKPQGKKDYQLYRATLKWKVER